MGTFPRHSGLFVFAAIATAAVVLMGVMGWPQPARALEFSGLIVAAILTAVLAAQRPASEDRGMMPLAFVIHFASLLLFGPLVTMIMVSAGASAYMLADPKWTRPPEHTLVNAATTIAAIHAAGVVHTGFGGTQGHFVWPWQGVPILFAVAVYALAHGAISGVVMPFVTRQPINRLWLRTVIRDCPHHIIGAGLAIGLIEIIDHQLWEVLPVAALPLFFAHRAYCAHVSQIEYEHRSQEAIESLDQGIAVIDGRGLITLWNVALERMVGCARERALGRSLFDAFWTRPSPQIGKAHASVQSSLWSPSCPSSHCSPASTIELPHASSVHSGPQPSPPAVPPSSHCSPGPRSPSPQTLRTQPVRHALPGPLLSPWSHCSTPLP
jgi:PAS domain-containing protein